MTKEEKLKDLLNKYLSGSITEADKEILFYLVNNGEFKDVTNSELYKLWENKNEIRIPASPDKIFENIRLSLNIDENKIRQDDLILKGIEYTRLKSSHKFLNVFIRYAAIVIFAMVFLTLINYFKEKNGAHEVALHEITAPNGSRVRVLLSDSTEVWLNSGSRISYPEYFNSTERSVFLEGEAFFNVRRNKSKPFYIKTSDLNIKVLGTSLNVKSYTEENLIETSLISGQIEIREISPEGTVVKPTLLLPDQKALYNKETGQMRIENRRIISQKIVNNDKLVGKKEQLNTNIQADIAWKDNKLVFNNETFSSLAIRLERWYNVEIDLSDEELLSFRFTGILENETIEQAMYAFTIASSMEYKFEKNKITVWKSNK